MLCISYVKKAIINILVGSGSLGNTFLYLVYLGLAKAVLIVLSVG